ncbi:hypothetical protein [Streptomyces syringium]|uniref:hypothetical protein n=1 Tax=Streptomyces syringium TaxID=76729 RepID=UPI0034119690
MKFKEWARSGCVATESAFPLSAAQRAATVRITSRRTLETVMLLSPDRPLLPVADARAILARARDEEEPEVYAGVSLLLLAGLRPREVEELRVGSYRPVTRQLDAAALRPRTIRIAPSAAAAVDAYLATQVIDPEDYLLPGMRSTRLVQLVRRVAAAAGVEAGVHELRRVAVGAVLDDGTPVHHVELYFGMTKTSVRNGLTVVREGYDVGIADVLEATFA